jgi:CRISPR/Cas system-associated exonuclease Cas4 (RecB family)
MNYTRQDILGLQLKSMLGLRKLTRAEFFTRLQLIRTVEPLVDQAFRISEEKILREQSDDSPHGNPWHVSFHGSQFPGNNPMACPRQALYRMMDFPSSEPMSRLLRQTADSGKQAEVTIVEAFQNSGMLLSSADPYKQTGFEYPEAWLTGSVDAVILLNNKPLPVEIKERKAEVIQEMQIGRGPFPEHVSQVKVETAFVRHYQKLGLWLSDLDLCTHGTIYYVSRDNPLDTAEFRVDHDENFWVAGLETLKRWRVWFEEDFIPELNPGKRSSKFGHPNGWRWSQKPCQYCPFKKTCQLDFREGCTQLSESNGVNRAKMIRKDYDAEIARLRVRARWAEKKAAV